MKKLLIATLAIFGLGGAYAIAQVYNGPPQPVALVCAYNSGGPPAVVAGKFYYVQCDINGKIIIE